jgi:opacity protein-like surface antigen
MLRSLSFALIVTLFLAPQFAKGDYTIYKTNKKKTRGYVRIEKGAVKMGDHFVGELSNGVECKFRVRKVKKNKAMLDLRRCSARKKIKKGLAIELVSKGGKTAGKKKEFVSNIGFSLFYSMADTLESEGEARVGAYSFDDYKGSSKMGGAIGFAVDYLHTQANGIGYGGGFSYEMTRDFTTYSESAGGNNSSGDYKDPVPTLSLMTLYGNGNYSFPVGDMLLFAFAGLNYSLPTLDTEGGEASGTIGYQLGAGLFVIEKLSVELSYRMIRLNGKSDYGGIERTFSGASLDGLMLLVRYRPL